MKSFSGDIPKTLSDSRWRPVKDSADFELYRRRRGGWQWYGIIPVQIEAEDTGHLHLYFEKAERDHPEGLVPGLVIIGIVIALLVLPVSRYITKRIRGLAESASRITEGDLSHRATVKGKDEIGELGRAFNRMADKLEKMIQGGKELTANISHELRSPLARIRVAEELLREKCDATGEKELKRHLDSIQGDIEEMDRLIGQILDLSKMDLHDVPLNLEDMDPPAMIDELLEKLQPAIGLKAVRLTKEFSFNQPFVGDRKALRTAFSNVLDNAAKFVPEKGNLIVKVIPENDWLKISITNSSDPISPEDLERIFEPFYRQRETSKRGSGLGLAITKKIIERHGGSIRAVNSPEGLEIQILIPSADARE
ncbi:MAG: HAMP domain-containing histidine kinase [Deltaproteobacteria bacterium]|nr:HAMP domain-containing histidine kinase [Deltaproteobacteria bacterium]